MATSMTLEEVQEFLRKQRTLILSTTKKDGAPVAHALWFVYMDNAVYFNIQAKSFKYRNILRDNRVCCLAEAGEQYLDLRGVMIQGHCTKVEDPDEQARLEVEREAKQDRIGSGMEDMPAWFHESRQRRLGRGDRVLLKVPMEKMTTWDFSMVRDHYTKRA